MAELSATATSDGSAQVYNLDHSPLARMKRTGTLSERQYAAAERFAEDFFSSARLQSRLDEKIEKNPCNYPPPPPP